MENVAEVAPLAYRILAKGYLYGEGIYQNIAKATDYLKLAAEGGDPEAQFNLGIMYSKGQGVPKDICESLRFYKAAGDAGFANAQVNFNALFDRKHFERK